MNFAEFLKPEFVALPLILYAIGAFIKMTPKCKDWIIPFVLSSVGIGLAIIYLLSVSLPVSGQEILGLIFAGITQGILAAAVAVLANQMFKQATTGREEDSTEVDG